MDFVHADKDGGHFGRDKTIDINIYTTCHSPFPFKKDRKINVIDVKIGTSSVINMLCDKQSS